MDPAGCAPHQPKPRSGTPGSTPAARAVACSAAPVADSHTGIKELALAQGTLMSMVDVAGQKQLNPHLHRMRGWPPLGGEAASGPAPDARGVAWLRKTFRPRAKATVHPRRHLQ